MPESFLSVLKDFWPHVSGWVTVYDQSYPLFIVPSGGQRGYLLATFFRRFCYLIYQIMSLNFSQGTAFDLQYAGNIVLLTDGARIIQQTSLIRVRVCIHLTVVVPLIKWSVDFSTSSV